MAGVQESEWHHFTSRGCVERWAFSREIGTGRLAMAPLARVRFLWLTTHGFVGRQHERALGDDGYYEVSKQVCIYSRRSRLLWGSGNARRNRMAVGYEDGARFLNRDSWNVGVLEKRWIGRRERSEISNGVHRRGRAIRNAALVDGWKLWRLTATAAAMVLVGFPRRGNWGQRFAANPQNAAGCGGMVRQ